MAERVAALEGKVGEKTIQEHFREQAELIDELLAQRFHEFDKRWSLRFAAIERTIGSLQSEAGTLKSDVGTLKGDVGTLKGDVRTLKGDVRTLKTDVSSLQKDMVIVREGISILLKRRPQ